MKNKLLLLISAYFLIMILGLISCVKCGPFPNKFKLTSLECNNYSAVYSESGETKLVLSEIENDTVVYDKYSILIIPHSETYFSMISRTNSFNIINSAYACSPVTPTTDERIDSIKIICDKAFDTNHPIGTDLAGLFDIVIVDPMNNIYYEKFDLSEYVKTNPTRAIEMVLILKSPPDLTSDFEFMIKYYQEGIDYDYFEFKTKNIVIKNE